MLVFVAWSGDVSHKVAKALCEWLHKLNPSLRTYISDDIDTGKVWFSELKSKFGEADFAILCLTKENLSSPWLFFEAGAMMMNERARVAPLCFDVKPSEIQGPLRYFQSVTCEKAGIRHLVRTLNNACGESKLTDTDMDARFEKTYPNLHSSLYPLEKGWIKVTDDFFLAPIP